MAPDWPGFVQRAAGEAFRDPRIREACSSRYRSGIKFRRVRAAGRINRPDGTGPIDCLFNHLTCEFCCEFGGRIAACIPPPGGRGHPPPLCPNNIHRAILSGPRSRTGLNGPRLARIRSESRGEAFRDPRIREACSSRYAPGRRPFSVSTRRPIARPTTGRGSRFLDRGARRSAPHR